MMKKSLLIIQMVVFCILVYGQGYQQDSSLLEKNQLLANLISPSLGYETRLSRKTSLAFKGGLGFGVAYENYDGGKIDIGLWPYLKADYRYYFNLDERAKKSLNTSHNSGNFIALNTMFNYPMPTPLSIGHDYSWLVGPVWGFQRTYWNLVNLNVALGMGAFKREGQNIIPWPIIDYSLGIRIGK